ncbi:MAG: zinc ribbon domain-containing protein [Saprospiraceae bacterium]
MFCPNCGQAARPESARCGHCNFKLPKNLRPPAGPASSVEVACWNCAQTNPPDADRCAHCNARCTGQAGPPKAANRFSSIQHAISHDQ